MCNFNFLLVLKINFPLLIYSSKSNKAKSADKIYKP